MVYKTKLYKIASTHQNLRSEVIEGEAWDLPALGDGFCLYGKGLEFGTRIVRTTTIIAIARISNTFLFETRNSTYCLHLEGPSEDPKKDVDSPAV